AQVRQVGGDNRSPLIECFVARHGLPPSTWSIWQYPQYAVWRAGLATGSVSHSLVLTQKPTPESPQGGKGPRCAVQVMKPPEVDTNDLVFAPPFSPKCN